MSGGLEEGELEDGEVHEHHTAEAEESGEASGYEHDAGAPEEHPAVQPVQQPQLLAQQPVQQPRGHADAGPPGPSSSLSPHGNRPRVMSGPPGRLAHVTNGRHASRLRGADGRGMMEASKEERENEELVSALRELTRFSSFQDVMRSMDTVCKDLKQAIKKLEKLFRRVKKKKGESIEEYPECFQFSKRILEGLQNVNKFSQTSAFLARDDEAAKALFRAAMNYRHDIFNSSLKQELERMVRNSKAFKSVLEKRTPGGSAAAGAGAEQPAAGGSGAGTAAAEAAGPAAATTEGAVSGSAGAPSATPGSRQGGEREASPGTQQQDAGAQEAVSPQHWGGTPPGSGQDHQHQHDHPNDQERHAERGGQQGTSAAAPASGHQVHAHSSRTGAKSGSNFRLKIVVASSAGDLSNAAAAGKHAAGGSSHAGHHDPDAPAPKRLKQEHHQQQQHAPQRSAASSDESDEDRKPPHLRWAVADADAGGANGLPVPPPESPVSGAELGGMNGGGPFEDGASFEDGRHVGLGLGHAAVRVKHEVGSSGALGPPGEYDAIGCLERGKLVLVVDLDAVLVDTVPVSQLEAPLQEALHARCSSEASSSLEPRRELFLLEQLGLWAKLRPGARAFLQRASQRFELWAHTRRSWQYADAVVELLDPDRQLLGGCVVAQQGEMEHGGPGAAKRLLAALDARWPVAMVLDTPGASWLADLANLYAAPPYQYFTTTTSPLGTGMATRPLLAMNRDECPQQGVLFGLLPVLEAVHARVLMLYGSQGSPPHALGPGACAAQPWGVPAVLQEQRECVLAGVHITFSRVCSSSQQAVSAHPLWRLAEACGATCSTATSDLTTHVVALSRNTEKAAWALRNGRHLVYPSWLECSCLMWHKADETYFSVQ